MIRTREEEEQEYQQEKQRVLQRVSRQGMRLERMKPKWQADRDVVLAAVRSCGVALEFADEELQADKEIVMEALKNQRRAWDYVDEDLKRDREFAFELIKQDTRIFKYLSDELRTNKDLLLFFLKDTVNRKSCPQYSISQSTLQDDEVLLQIIELFRSDMKWVEDHRFLWLNKSLEFQLEALKRNGLYLSFMWSWRFDREIVKIALKNHKGAWNYVGDSLKCDRELALLASGIWDAQRMEKAKDLVVHFQ